MNEQTELLLTVPELARRTQTSRAWVYSKLKTGELVGVRLPGNRLLRIPASELDKFRPAARRADMSEQNRQKGGHVWGIPEKRESVGPTSDASSKHNRLDHTADQTVKS
ncbi:MAG: helix-turn-helix domain-containing protein [Deltaproteobacteria bacterium]|nr:helix-turn-helix domain-containing protein [Deltaproteobacteria bacterium]